MDPMSTTQSAAGDPHRDESAAAKLWAVYISEAEKYDKALVASWRSDMDGLLIFAGLFSASLTAFLIESYKTLTPDQGDRTIAILTHISLQLSASSNGSSMELPIPGIFTPSATSLACNTLWFLSLGLSLSCALIATLVEQWARDFIQKTDMRPSPIIRARIFSYLYYGLRRFNMHAVVELIPLLLHIALILFLGGLVAFLQPVNTAMAAVAAALLIVIFCLYSYLTVLPIFHSDCPYRTPLSSLMRNISMQATSLRRLPAFALRLSTFARYLCFQLSSRRIQAPGLLLRGLGIAHTVPSCGDSENPTFVEVMTQEATRDSPERVARDCRALIWTMKSLTDEQELEPLVEAIPDVIWGGTGRRHLYDQQIGVLLRHPDVRLIPRIEGLMRSCESGLLANETRHRRQISCLKALWATAYLGVEAHKPYWFTTESFRTPEVFDSAVRPYLVSAQCLAKLNIARCSEAESRRMRERADAADISYDIPFHPQGSTDLRIIIGYLEESSALEFPPYELFATSSAISTFALSERDRLHIRAGFATIISEHNVDRLKAHLEIHHIDRIVRILLSRWKSGPDLPDDRVPFFTETLLRYIGSRDSDAPLMVGLGGADAVQLSSSIKLYLGQNISFEPEIFEALWRMCTFLHRKGDPPQSQDRICDFDDLTVMKVQNTAPPDIGQSVTALMQLAMLQSLPSEQLPSKNPPDIRRRMSPVPYDAIWNEARSETCWLILIEFLEHCASEYVPYNMVNTLQCILESTLWRRFRINPGIQWRFAQSLWGLCNIQIPVGDGTATTRAPRMNLIQILVDSFIFAEYRRPRASRGLVYLESAGALKKTLDASQCVPDLPKVDLRVIRALREDYEIAVETGTSTQE
ncbi:hypothetical protein C8R44DRAFT_979907 [Mycena epipterygia]|nr:hypothetical protein C8R44DRAFT_979907 [Mycena epipterygia]